MLDECSGEKFEELLASFSTVVLRKVMIAKKDGTPAISRSFALVTKLSQNDQKSLLPLAIAHRASLSALLRRKEQLRGRYTHFQDVLDGRRDHLDQREASLDSGKEINGRVKLGRKETEQAMKQIGLYWKGDAKWQEVLVGHDAKVAHDPLLDVPFEVTWGRVQGGSGASNPATESKGLLEDLETRIADQEARLQKWKQFRTELTNESSRFAANKVQSAGPKPTASIGISFDAHKDLIVGRKMIQEPESLQYPDVLETSRVIEYEKLVKSLKKELRDVDEPRKRGHRLVHEDVLHLGPEFQLTPHIGNAQRMGKLSEYEQKKITREAETSPYIRNSASGRTTSEGSESNRNPEIISSSSKECRTPKPNEPSRTNKPEVSSTFGSSSTHFIANINSKANDTPDTEYDEDELLAAEIVSLTMNAGPSPIKGQRSLAERTRQSLASTSSSHYTLPDAPTMPPPLMRVPRPSLSVRPAVGPDMKATLLERTRQSMSILPTEPRKTAHKHHLSKQFPTNQFETPRKQLARAQDAEKKTPPEKLFSDDVEYASVFKSRPRIAMSPTPSPLAGEDSSIDDITSGEVNATG